MNFSTSDLLRNLNLSFPAGMELNSVIIFSRPVFRVRQMNVVNSRFMFSGHPSGRSGRVVPWYSTLRFSMRHALTANGKSRKITVSARSSLSGQVPDRPPSKIHYCRASVDFPEPGWPIIMTRFLLLTAIRKYSRSG